MAFSSASSSSPSSRPIKSPRHAQAHVSCAWKKFSVPNGPNWVYASGGSRMVRFDFARALDEHIASEDETCGSSQEYYALKSMGSPSKPSGSIVPPALPTYKTDPRFLYPTQRQNYAFNFDRVTAADIQSMNEALPFGPMTLPERKSKTKENAEKVQLPLFSEPNPLIFSNKTTNFNADAPLTAAPVKTTKSPFNTRSTALTTRSRNNDSYSRQVSSRKSNVTIRRK